MTRSRQIAVGGMALLGGQLFVSLAQIVYSGFTSRALPPEAFGWFSVAMSATGLAALFLASGLASFVVSRREIDAHLATWLWILSWLAGGLGAAALLLLAPLWADAWRAGGAVPLTRLLALQVLLASPAAVQSAFLRREGRPSADALTQVSAAVVGMVVGAVLVATRGDELSLAASPTIAALVTLVLAAALRRDRPGLAPPGGVGAVLRFSWQVTAQNLVFFVYLSLAVWSVSVAADSAELGQFSRAALVTGLPATALSSALSRAVQPFYRHMSAPSASRLAVTDAVTVASFIAFPAFAGLASVGPSLVRVWLGPGWETAGAWVPPLALGYGVYCVFTMLASAGETLSEFRVVRRSQAAMAVPAAVVTAIVLATGESAAAAWLMLAISTVGLAALTTGLSRSGQVDRRMLARRLATHAVWAGGIAGVALLAQLVLEAVTQPGALARLTVSVAAGLLVAAVFLRRQPGWRVLVDRGVLPRRFDRG